MAMSSFSEKQKRMFLIDSGASSHFMFHKDLMNEVKKIDPIHVSGINGTIKVNETGTVQFNTTVKFGNKPVKNTITLNDVRYCSSTKYNLLSVAQMVSVGCTVIMTDKGCYVIDRGVFKMNQHLYDNTLIFAKRSENSFVVMAEAEEDQEEPSIPSKPGFSFHRAKRHRAERNKEDEIPNLSQSARAALGKSRQVRRSQGGDNSQSAGASGASGASGRNPKIPKHNNSTSSSAQADEKGDA